MAETQLYQWQTVKKFNGQWPMPEPDSVHARLVPGVHASLVGTMDELFDNRPKDLDVGQTAWRLHKVL